MEEPRLYDIKDAAHHLGVAPSTLRYWESQGLVRAGRNQTNDYRQYSLHDLIEASEIAFYRKLGVPVKELESYHALSAHGLDDALARTEDDVERRITELEATRARLARQRSLNAQAGILQHEGMHPATPEMTRLSTIDYDSSEPWKLLVNEPWRYGVLIEAENPSNVREVVVDARTDGGETLWRRAPSHGPATCRSCLLKVSPVNFSSNAHNLFEEASKQGLQPHLLVGSYLLTASDEEGRWDYHHGWVIGTPH